MTNMTTPFGSVLTRVASISRAMDDVFAPELSNNWIPPLDATESENAYVVTIDLPGIKRENIKINFDRGVLTVTGTREGASEQSNGDRFYVRERAMGTFTRSVRFARDVDGDKIDARLENGVLTITVHKAATALPRQIEVQGA
ncbi:MAG TPA: Hsp20/alpha crystallin family protein [Gemmatimonadaceae bacterium]|nr:Hsp20/alpha crystallin family protein [Gemmatimonadaceae bacterium]